jgi:hypothetical protein
MVPEGYHERLGIIDSERPKLLMVPEGIIDSGLCG